MEGKEEIDGAVWPSIVARTTIERIRPLEQKIQYQVIFELRSVGSLVVPSAHERSIKSHA